ncbi:MAG: hypothetical protein HFH67_18060 [Lachnospiraceae bacterium]|nr:hypothetical protein [Lachnospiraceae bacterium]
MQEKTALSGRDRAAYINSLQKNPNFTKEIIQLVKSDLEAGVSKEETEEYSSSGRYSYQQMCVYSRCLRKGYSQEAKKLILKDTFSAGQMEAAVEFYEKGVPLAKVAGIMENAGQDIDGMKCMLQQELIKSGGLKNAEETLENSCGQDRDHVESLLKQVQETVAKISLYEEKYDAMDKKLQELLAQKQDMAVQERLLAQLAEREKMLADQQDQLNGAMAEIAKLKKGQEKASRPAVQAEGKSKAAGIERPEDGKTDSTALQREKTKRQTQSVSEYGCQMALLDQDGKVVKLLPIEHTERKENTSMLSGFFSRLFFRRRLDIVKLLAGKNLETGQLVQVRNAIEKGLTENQMLTLVNSRLPAEQMEEIINIAVYENKGIIQ